MVQPYEFTQKQLSVIMPLIQRMTVIELHDMFGTLQPATRYPDPKRAKIQAVMLALCDMAEAEYARRRR